MGAEYRCAECNGSFLSTKDVLKHVKATAHKAHKCGYCGEMFKLEADAYVHATRQHANIAVFSCPQCTKSFPIEASLVTHFLSKHGSADLIPCRQCCQTFTTSEALLTHTRDLHRPTPEAVTELFPELSTGASASNATPKPYISRKSECTTAATINREPNPVEVEPQHQCHICDTAFTDLSQHFEQVHPSLRCRACSKLFECSRDIHIQDTPYCPSCTLMYSSEAETSIHNKISQDNPYVLAECLLCEKRCATAKVLEDHIAAAHQGVAVRAQMATDSSKGMDDEMTASGGSPPGVECSEANCTRSILPTCPEAKESTKSSDNHRSNVGDKHGRSDSNGADPPHSEHIVIDDSAAIHEPDLATTENAPPISHLSGVSNRREHNLALVTFHSDTGAQVDRIPGFVDADDDHATQEPEGPSVRYQPREHHFASAPRAASAVPDERAEGPGEAQTNEAPFPETPSKTKNTASTFHGRTNLEDPALAPHAPALVCKVCHNAPTSPMITMCGHIFCFRCIITEISENFRCPACKHPILVEVNL